MRKDFQVSLVAAATLASLSMAQLPRECFYITEMHGPQEDEAELLSNLPTLMAMYKPGMRMRSIVAHQDEIELSLNGLQVNLSQDIYANSQLKESLELSVIGSRVDEWTSRNFDFQDMQPDKISIVQDEIYGICDVILFEGVSNKKSLGSEPIDCVPGMYGITETTLRLPEETPLVGFHGMVDSFGILSLGLILVDTLDSVCQHPLDYSNMSVYQGMDDFQKSKALEDSITEDEKARASALESILAQDALVKAQQSKEELLKQIKALHEWSPIKLQKLDSVDDLKAVLDHLAELDYEDKPVTKSELKAIFQKLADYYYESDYDESLTVTISDIKTVYDRLAAVDGLPDADADFSGRNPSDSASTEELTFLLDTLSEHYASGPGRIEDLDAYATESLLTIFEKMDEYYTIGEGKVQKESMNMWLLYDYLNEIFGKPSDYDLEMDDVWELYNEFQSETKVERTFEGEQIEGVEDLISIAEREQEARLSELLNEMYRYERIEGESQSILDSRYDQMDESIQTLVERMETEDDRLIGMENLILQGQVEAERRQGGNNRGGMMDTVDPSTLAPNALTSMDNAGPVNPATFNPNAIEQQVTTASTSQEGTAITSEQLDEKVEIFADRMIYTFIAILFVTLAVGIIAGSVCFYCILKKVRKNGAADLHQSKRGGVHFRADSIDTNGFSRSNINVINGAQPICLTEAPMQTQADNQCMDTQEEEYDSAVQVKDTVRTINCTDDDEDDIGKIISKRGLNFQAPSGRRQTYQVNKKKNFSAHKQDSDDNDENVTPNIVNKMNNAM